MTDSTITRWLGQRSLAQYGSLKGAHERECRKRALRVDCGKVIACRLRSTTKDARWRAEKQQNVMTEGGAIEEAQVRQNYSKRPRTITNLQDVFA